MGCSRNDVSVNPSTVFTEGTFSIVSCVYPGESGSENLFGIQGTRVTPHRTTPHHSIELSFFWRITTSGGILVRTVNKGPFTYTTAVRGREIEIPQKIKTPSNAI